ncbi:DinB family protein [Curtobacterium sp. MCBD17_021]|uniref:DinB family protein n=1 Tax=Curtobacterium sp. MCBD17_021 TaxID=2175665 RepID=UPI000DA71138|nr:DinB family protein [Curtobacterium sp. MCBD17_021]PZE65420.1 mini-circle protein [Curtobacterium sp. MCBD17_021]
MDAGVDEHGRIEPDVGGDEWGTLNGFLDYQRATFAWKVAGLDAAQLARPLPPSTMTLAGLVKHLAYVEHGWFDGCLLGEPRREPWASVDWAATPDWDWDSAIGQDPAELLTLWEGSVTQARSVALSAYETGGLDQKAVSVWRDGRSPSLRWILMHMVEEYARHNGHADLLREAIDGQVGE